MASESFLARDNYDRYTYARDNGHLDYVAKDKMCGDFFFGLQWEETLRKRLERAGKPVMTINKVLATLTSVMGEQLKNRADVAYRPARDGSSQIAEALTKVFINFETNNELDMLESQLFDDGIIGSRGFYDLRVSFDDHLMGEAELSLLHPHNVVLDPDASSYDPDKWDEVFITSWMTPELIGQKYGKDKGERLKNRSRSDFSFGYDSIDTIHDTFGGVATERVGDTPDDKRRIRVIERQFRTYVNAEHLVDPRTGDMRPVPANWDEARVAQVKELFGLRSITRKVPRIHWRVSADDVLLFDKLSPLKHFTPIPYFPYFRRGRTMGLVENLVSAQQILNKVSSQELHVLNSSANGGWKIKKSSLQNMSIDELETRGAETGLVLELDEVSDAEKIQPNQIPTGLDRITYKQDDYIKEISGVSDSARGFDREDVAARAIQAKKAAGAVNLAKPFENLAWTRKLLARNALDIFQAFYTEERTLVIAGKGVGQQDEELTINGMTPEGEAINDLMIGEYSVVVTTVPARDSFQETQLEEATRLREAGVPVPDHVMIENSNLSKKHEILQAMQDSGAQERQARAEEAALRKAELENAEKEVEIERKRNEAELARARAEKTTVDAQVAVSEAGARDSEQSQLMLDKYKFDMEMRLERYKVDEELKLKRETMRRELMIKRQQAQQTAREAPSQ